MTRDAVASGIAPSIKTGAAGHSILFITHNIHHVFQVADRAEVMRRGEVVADLLLAGSGVLTVEGLIMGGELKAEVAHG